MIFGGVFERHPRLKVVFTEQRTDWVPGTIRDMDSIYIYLRQVQGAAQAISKAPSEYWKPNCFLAGSFLSPFEVGQRDEIGVHNLMWGTDYPHVEGTWKRTLDSIRFAFAGVEENAMRLVLGENAVQVFGLDQDALGPVVDRIGPTIAELSDPLREFPEFVGCAFRTIGAWA
jgi:predicted TIM-barrel fold metal-dependent hydrolase